MHKFKLTLCCLAIGSAGCNQTDSVVPAAAPKPIAAASPTVVIEASPSVSTAAVAPTTPTVPLVTPPEDRLEPSSIENARLPNGSILSAEPPSDPKNKKTRP